MRPETSQKPPRRQRSREPGTPDAAGPRAPALGAGMGAGRPAPTTVGRGGAVAVIHSPIAPSAPKVARQVFGGGRSVLREWKLSGPSSLASEGWKEESKTGRNKTRSTKTRVAAR